MTNACTSCLVTAWSRNGLTLPMALRWKWAARQTLLICLSMVMCWSNSAPRSLADSLQWMVASPAVRVCGKSSVGRLRAKHHQFSFAVIQYTHVAPRPCSYTQDSTIHRTDSVRGRIPRKHKLKIQLSVIRKQVKLQSQRPEKLPQRRSVYREQQGAQNRPLRHTTHKSPAGWPLWRWWTI